MSIGATSEALYGLGFDIAPRRKKEMVKACLMAVAMVAILAMPADAQLSSQQQRMKDCNTQAAGMTGQARKQFMSSCLSGSAQTQGPHCARGKPCGNTCIAMNEVCHK
jgi:hypothetical protein